MADDILTLRVEDQASAGAAAAESAINKYGAAAEVAETRVARLDRTAGQLANRYDAVTKTANRLAAAESELARARETMSRGVETTAADLGQQQRVIDTLSARVVGLRRAYEEVSAASGGVGAATVAASAEMSRADAALQRYGGNLARASAAAQAFRDQLDPVAAVYRQQSTALAELSTLTAAGLLSDRDRAASVERLTAATRAQVAELDGSAAANRRAAAAAAEASKVAAAAQAATARQAAASQAELNNQAKAFVAVADPAAAAMARYNEQVAIGDKLLAAGLITRAQHVAGLKAMQVTTDHVTASNAAGANSLRNLGLQSIDVFQQIAAGAPVMTTLIQQGGQVAQVTLAAGGGFASLGRAIGGALTSAMAALLSPVGLVAAGLAAATAATVGFAIQAETAERRMLALRNTLAATRADYVGMADAAEKAARAVAGSSGVGTDDARAAAGLFASQRSFVGTQQQLESLLRVSNDVATRLGITLPEAAAKLAPAMRDASAVAQEWQGKLAGLDAAFTQSIQSQVRAGDAAGAYERLMAKLKASTEGAAEAAESKLGRALTSLQNQFVSANGDPSSFGTALTDLMAKYVNYLEFLVKTAKQGGAFLSFLAERAPGGTAAPAGAPSVPLNPLDPAGRGYGLGPGTPTTGYAATQLLEAEAARQRTPPAQLAFARATMAAESTNNQGAVSPKGATGLFQLMPGTAAGLGVDPSTASGNVSGGLKYIAQLWADPDFGGDPDLVAMAYNWGPGNTKRFLKGTQDLGDIPAETRGHVLKVTGNDLATRFGDSSLPLPPTPPMGIGATAPNSFGVATDPNQAIDAAVGRASSGSSAVTQRQALEDIKAYREALALLAAQGITTGEKVSVLREGLLNAGKAAAEAVGPVGRLLQGIGDQARAAELMTAAYGKGHAAVQAATIQLRAEEAARSVAGRGTAEHAAAVARLTAEYQDLAAKQAAQAVAAKTLDNGDALRLIQAETEAVGMGTEARARHIAAIRAEQELNRAGVPLQSDVGQAYLDSADAIATATANLDQYKAAMASVEQMATSVFDNVAQAITNSLLSGQGQAVNWANTMRGLFAQVLNEGLKLAALNPILNTVFGGQRSTLSSVAGALASRGGAAGAAGGGSSGGGGMFGGLGDLFQIGSLSEKLGLTNIGETLGLTGPGGLLSDVGGFLSTPLWGATAGIEAASASQIAAATAPSGLFSEAAAAGNMGISSSVGSAGTSILGLAGGVGAGFGAGNMLGGFVQSSMGKVGPAPSIGAGLGATAGAIAGSFVPVIGPLLGGLIGGLIGGGGGGLIGPKAATPFSATGLAVDDSGMLGVGRTVSQLVDTSAEVAALGEQVARVNALLSAGGARIANGASQDEFGQSRLIGNSGEWLNFGQGDGRPGDLSQAFGELRFTSTDPAKASALDGKTFGTLDELAAVLQRVAESAAAAANFLDQTVPAMTATGSTVGVVTAQLDAVNKQYAEAIATAQRMRAEGNLGADVNARLVQSETDLAAARDRATAKIDAAAQKTLALLDSNLAQRSANAKAAATGADADSMAAQLMAFDADAKQQQEAFAESYVNMYGEAVKASQEYAGRALELDRVLSAERLAITRAYDEKATEAARAAGERALAAAKAAQAGVDNSWAAAAARATQSVQSLTAFSGSLQLGDASPLSAQDRYAFAQTRFKDTAVRASMGESASVDGLQTAINDLLGASRAINGSGAAYAQDFGQAMAAIDAVSRVPADVLTASVYVSNSREAAAVVVTAIDGTATIFTTETRGATKVLFDAVTGAASVVYSGNQASVAAIGGTTAAVTAGAQDAVAALGGAVSAITAGGLAAANGTTAAVAAGNQAAVAALKAAAELIAAGTASTSAGLGGTVAAFSAGTQAALAAYGNTTATIAAGNQTTAAGLTGATSAVTAGAQAAIAAYNAAIEAIAAGDRVNATGISGTTAAVTAGAQAALAAYNSTVAAIEAGNVATVSGLGGTASAVATGGQATVTALSGSATAITGAQFAASGLLSQAINSASQVITAGQGGSTQVLVQSVDGVTRAYAVETQQSTQALRLALGELGQSIGTETRALLDALGTLDAAPVVNLPAPVVNVAGPVVNIPAGSTDGAVWGSAESIKRAIDSAATYAGDQLWRATANANSNAANIGQHIVTTLWDVAYRLRDDSLRGSVFTLETRNAAASIVAAIATLRAEMERVRQAIGVGLPGRVYGGDGGDSGNFG